MSKQPIKPKAKLCLWGEMRTRGITLGINNEIARIRAEIVKKESLIRRNSEEMLRKEVENLKSEGVNEKVRIQLFKIVKVRYLL